MTEDELINRIRDCLNQLDANTQAATDLRRDRRQAVEALLAVPGWLLERIGKVFGRTKQTISQWLR